MPARTSSTNLHPLLHYPVKMCLCASIAMTSTLRVKNRVLYHLKKHPSVPVVGLQFEAVTLLFFLMRIYHPKLPQVSSFNELNTACMPNIIRPCYFVLVYLVFFSIAAPLNDYILSHCCVNTIEYLKAYTTNNHLTYY